MEEVIIADQIIKIIIMLLVFAFKLYIILFYGLSLIIGGCIKLLKIGTKKLTDYVAYTVSKNMVVRMKNIQVEIKE